MALLVGEAVGLGEAGDGIGGDGVGEEVAVVRGPVEVGGVDGLGGRACGVVAGAAGGVGEDGVGEGDGLEGCVGFGALLGGDLVCGERLVLLR